jgi:FAD:protein FMN transferase
MKACSVNRINHKSLFLLLVLGCITAMLIGCQQPYPSGQKPAKDYPEYISKSDFLLNTVVSIQLYDKQDEGLIDEAFALIRKYEEIFSRTSETSELYKLNHGTAPRFSDQELTYSISSELADILHYAIEYSQLTDGAFDLTVAPLTNLWDFKAANPSIPDPIKLQQALTLVDYDNVRLSDTVLTFLKEGMGIELGAIAKGYIADRVKEFLIVNDVKSAIINLGGNLLCIGSKPDQRPFHIGIQKPYADRNETIATMEITDKSVVSSGIYERYFEQGGKFYHHILNPQTGYPYDNGLISVTIISNQSVDGDGLSTSCFALGLEEGLKLIERTPDTYAVFITQDYKLHYSSGFEDAIRILH